MGVIDDSGMPEFIGKLFGPAAADLIGLERLYRYELVSGYSTTNQSLFCL